MGGYHRGYHILVRTLATNYIVFKTYMYDVPWRKASYKHGGTTAYKINYGSHYVPPFSSWSQGPLYDVAPGDHRTCIIIRMMWVYLLPTVLGYLLISHRTMTNQIKLNDTQSSNIPWTRASYIGKHDIIGCLCPGREQWFWRGVQKLAIDVWTPVLKPPIVKW